MRKGTGAKLLARSLVLWEKRLLSLLQKQFEVKIYELSSYKNASCISHAASRSVPTIKIQQAVSSDPNQVESFFKNRILVVAGIRCPA